MTFTYFEREAIVTALVQTLAGPLDGSPGEEEEKAIRTSMLSALTKLTDQAVVDQEWHDVTEFYSGGTVRDGR